MSLEKLSGKAPKEATPLEVEPVLIKGPLEKIGKYAKEKQVGKHLKESLCVLVPLFLYINYYSFGATGAFLENKYSKERIRAEFKSKGPIIYNVLRPGMELFFIFMRKNKLFQVFF